MNKIFSVFKKKEEIQSQPDYIPTHEEIENNIENQLEKSNTEQQKISWHTEKRKLSEIKPAEYNPRKATKKETQNLSESIEKFNIADPIIINLDNTIIGGHFRYKILKNKYDNDYEIDVRVPNRLLSKEEEIELNIRLNKNTGEFDLDLLANFDERLLEQIGFTPEELNFSPNIETTESQDNIPEFKTETICKIGDVWKLGNHRLMCGDSSVITDVEKLMDGNVSDMMFTDPPYGVNYEGKTKDKLKIKNDNLKAEDLKTLISGWLSCSYSALRKGAYVLATVPSGDKYIYFLEKFIELGWFRQQLIWVKNNHVIGHNEYHYKHESILFGWIEGGVRHQCHDRTKNSVWNFDMPSSSKEHPTMKPVEMWEYGIKNHTISGDLVYEPFAGSGTTIIACEKTNRKCYAMEIDEHYCDVIIKRWEDFTGKKAELL